MVRADYADAVRPHVQMPKDLVKPPVYEIEKQLLA
jgi:hypothetical protein